MDVSFATSPHVVLTHLTDRLTGDRSKNLILTLTHSVL